MHLKPHCACRVPLHFQHAPHEPSSRVVVRSIAAAIASSIHAFNSNVVLAAEWTILGRVSTTWPEPEKDIHVLLHAAAPQHQHASLSSSSPLQPGEGHVLAVGIPSPYYRVRAFGCAGAIHYLYGQIPMPFSSYSR